MNTAGHKILAALASAALVAVSTGCTPKPLNLESGSQSTYMSVPVPTYTPTPMPTTTATPNPTPTVTPAAVAQPWNSAHIASGDYHTCIIDTNGGVWCWGGGGAGQLGNGLSQDSSTIVRVSYLVQGVKSIAAGGNHTCALTTAGAVYCWGSNAYGQIGDGTTTYRNVPTLVSGLSSGVVALAAGNVHTCAIVTSGAIYCWGDNTYGQLGIGSTTGSLVPTQLSFFSGTHTITVDPPARQGTQMRVAMITINGPKASAISLGYHHSCATDTLGAVYCWGFNADGRLGDGTTTQQTSPVAVQTLTSGVQSIAAGYYHTCAIDSGYQVWCWGDNTYGELGQGGGVGGSTPLLVSQLSFLAQNIVAGARHVCATDGVGQVSCWGDNSYGQLGQSSATQYELSPTLVGGVTGTIRGLAMAEYHSCALDGAGVQCWGNDYYGQLGDGKTQSASYSPVSVLGITPAQ